MNSPAPANSSADPDAGGLFGPVADWLVAASGQATGRLTAGTDPDGRPSLRLDYDFGEGSGFVVLRRATGLTLPEVFKVTFRLRGDGPSNHFEFKVAGPGGANVWRHLRSDYDLPTAWTELAVTERDLPFAWGPAGGGGPAAVEAVEFAVVAGPGGRGWLELAAFTLTDESPHTPNRPVASSHRPGHPPEGVFNGLGWQAAATDPNPCWEIDLGRLQRFGGLVLDWPEPLPPRVYQLEGSADERTWTSLHRASHACGPRSHVPTPRAEARFLRFRFASAAGAAIRGLTLKPDAFSHTPNEFIHAVAADQPRGWHPRYWHREQSYWTPVGSPAGRRRALLNEEGLLEIDEAGFSLEPFLWLDGRLVTWADAVTDPLLPATGAPVASVVWHLPALRLHIEPWVDGEGDQLTLRVTYRVEGIAPLPPDARLVVAVRPYQVNPPWQAFRNLGGISPVASIACESSGFRAAGRQVLAATPPVAAGAATFEEGGVMPFLAALTVPPRAAVEDPAGLASACAVWLLPADGTPLTLAVPFFDRCGPAAGTTRADALAKWENTLGRVVWRVPGSAAAAVACFRTAAGHILINRDGPAIQPGPRRYTRSWVRDCVIMGAALAKAGLPQPLHEFLTWYAGFQRADGFVPCVVDRDGIDWLVEHDSHGQWLWGIRERFRASGDPAELVPLLPGIRGAAGYLQRLRATRLTPEFRTPERLACYGLLPESASHEGYLAHPVHSYWDDFWGIRGLLAAADLATFLNLPGEAREWRDEAARFRTDVIRSLEQVIAQRGLDYLPGSVEWADFDPTATANAIALLDFADDLPPEPLRRMLATYLDGFRRKHRGEMPWHNYTAYEIRIIGAFVRLGLRAEAHELLEQFLTDRRPAAWNQWPEITWHDPRAPGHLGDVPHTWIAAEYLLALATMVVSEREDTDSLVIAAGLSWEWISQDDGFAVSGLPTRFGTVDFSMAVTVTGEIRMALGGALRLPPGGITVAPPLPDQHRILTASDDGGRPLPVAPDGRSVVLPFLPVTAVFNVAPAADSAGPRPVV